MTIILENYVKNVTSLQNVFNKIKFLKSLVFNPYSKQWNVSLKGWPKIETMIKANKRFLIIDQTPFWNEENPLILDKKEHSKQVFNGNILLRIR